MNRRELMKASAGAAAISALGKPLLAAAAKTADVDLKKFFSSQDPAVMKLTGQVFAKCILGKLFPPAEPMKHNWIGPGGGYKGQWIWDTMFVVDLLSILPGKEKIIRGVFRNYWDFQVRWNREMPDYAHDMVPCMIQPGNKKWVRFPAYSQIPILAWGVERVYRRNGDKELIKQCLKPLERFHEWYWRERDVTNIGLVAVGSYNPIVQHARWETFDYECNMDALKLTKHPKRKGRNEGKWYGDICVTGNTSFLVLGEKCLVRLAEIMGDKAMAARRQKRIDKSVAAMRKHMWDAEAGTFLSVNRDTLEKIPGATIGSWIPLHAGAATKDQAKRMAEVLGTDSWMTPLPIPTVDRKDKRWISHKFWRGDVWAPTNYQIAGGLADYGYRDLAGLIADKTVANAIANGISERYDSISGRKLGVEYLGMTCTVITMMLDGLTRKHKLQLLKT